MATWNSLMGEVEVSIKSILPPNEAQGVYTLRISPNATVEQLLRNVCKESNSAFRDEYCFRSSIGFLNRSDTIADAGLKDGEILYWTVNETKSSSSCMNIFWFLALVSFFIGVAGISTLFVMKFKKSEPIIDYAIVFDGGSSHTAMYVYKWDAAKLNGTAVAEQEGDVCKEGKGISSFVDNPFAAGNSLEACLSVAQKMIPENKHHSTPVYLGATAGMRILNISHPLASNQILESIRWTFKKSPFSFTDPQMAKIISGFDEGSFAWTTSNYVTNAFGVLKYRIDNKGLPAKTIMPNLGALDLGGASTQMAFIPADETSIPPGYANELELYGHDYKLYTHSYLCYGTNEVKTRIFAHLVNNESNKSATKFVHACLAKGYNFTLNRADIYDSPCVSGDVGRQAFGSSIHPSSSIANTDLAYTFMGNGNTAACQELVNEILINTSMPCNFASCSFNGVFQPPEQGAYYAFSSYYFTASFLNLTTADRSYFSHSQFLAAMDNICQMPWEELKKIPESVEFLVWYCENAVLINTLLKGYHFPDEAWPSINFVSQVSSSDVGWTLGFILNESNRYPSHENLDSILYTVPFVLLVILFVLILIVGGFLACQATEWGKRFGFSRRVSSSYSVI